MPIPSLDRVEAADAVPASTDVVIIGGGIAGVTAAFFLAEKGIRTVVCEKGRFAGEQSSRNWGWVRQMGRDRAELPLAIESLRLWRQLEPRWGIDAGFRQTGIVYAFRAGEDEEGLANWVESAEQHQLPIRRLDRTAIQRLLPGIAPDFHVAYHTADDGRAEPSKAVSAIAKAARERGAVLVADCAVRSIERKAGRVSAVITEKGETACSAAIVAGGVWSRLFLGNLGVTFPQLKLLGTAMRIETAAELPQMPVGGSDFAFRKRIDGGYTVSRRNASLVPIVPDSFRLFTQFLPTLKTSWRELRLRVGKQFFTELAMPRHWSADAITPFERFRILDPAPRPALNRAGLENTIRAFPAFGDARITHQWAGFIDAMPDGIPVIAPVPLVPGLFISSGYSGHGFGIGPGAGRLMADIVAGDNPLVDPAPFGLERFGMRNRA
ncbi:FAD-binding oxidoreductase [Mesorhizobium sp. M1E.F.Ca.ET.045.02.1.1]|uniref:NAD(P)/FAD-dependent oxidoreductase n=1 Tax=Mesorhizobium sp. M1E.F.Ca.ET.045.02.1.1 TaxID=2493672 RepID=UPI000F7611CA|nr:FAD-binding oxidoreductase [Mesorhizobium sp. M1E.F.Ca.ET.045.02.1.1]AZO25022.1 FAD-binding oxidoreductase [Mesorhizobium sp. M1E.F.Ca.ET.045.02.1.1]TKB17578.1 MAG: FAD-binding oxidoreductase [Mesorhizobium sp.]